MIKKNIMYVIKRETQEVLHVQSNILNKKSSDI